MQNLHHFWRCCNAEKSNTEARCGFVLVSHETRGQFLLPQNLVGGKQVRAPLHNADLEGGEIVAVPCAQKWSNNQLHR